jgi:hypothetical protein
VVNTVLLIENVAAATTTSTSIAFNVSKVVELKLAKSATSTKKR